MSKTAPDGDHAGELHEVTTEAHTQSANNSEVASDRNELAAERSEGQENVESAPGSAPAAGRSSAAEGGESDFENFASQFRPSWAPDVEPAPSIPAPVHASGPARVVRVGTRSDLSVPKLRKQRGAAYGIVGASLIGVAGLVYLAIASSSTHPGP
ncbi:MAG TPA: hypothetical protein VJR89_03480, partial [Polyangiales bacterium]|nr:hypothetical protein [Polyangiales bacterium]